MFVWTEKAFSSLHLQNWSQSETIVSHLKLISWERWPKAIWWVKKGVDSLSQQSYQKKYFDNGLRNLADECFFVGIMVAIALGQLLVYMPEATIQSIFGSNDTCPCILRLPEGSHVFYLDILRKEFPVLHHFLHPNLMPLNAKMILQILKPNFSPDGSTAFSREKSVLGLFVKYVGQVSGT